MHGVGSVKRTHVIYTPVVVIDIDSQRRADIVELRFTQPGFDTGVGLRQVAGLPDQMWQSGAKVDGMLSGATPYLQHCPRVAELYFEYLENRALIAFTALGVRFHTSYPAKFDSPYGSASLRAMQCPFCGQGDTRVTDSRLISSGDQIRRRRECLSCEERFTTYERAELSLPRVVKRDGTRVPFNEEKVRAGMLRSLEKRPVASDKVEAALGDIKHRLIASGEREIRSRVIGEQVMEALRVLDQVAYVRFASVYRSFQDVNAFREEIERLERELSPELRRHQIPLIPDE